MGRLSGRVAVITGGSRGIGRAVAELFVHEGAQVAIWDVLPEEGIKLAEKLNEDFGDVALFNKVNVSDLNAVLNAREIALEKFGKVDILINNAGITRDRSLMKMSPEEWQQVLDVNLSGVFNYTKAFASHMKENGYGRIISASSVSGIYGNFGQTNYSATKAGIIGMTKVWAKELGRYGITANCIAPGFTQTDMTDLIPEDIKERQIKAIPVQRIGQPMEIANGYLFLASEEASFVSGVCLPIDGGFRL